MLDVPLRDISAIRQVTVVKNPPPVTDVDAWSRPFLLNDSEQATLFFGNAKLQKALATYCGTYPKTLQKAKGATLGRDQTRIEDADIAKECNDVSAPMVPLVDIKDVEGGEMFMDSVYFFGYDNHPRMKYIGLTPSQASMLKFLFIGKVQTILIKTSSLMKVTSESVGPACENCDYFESITAWNLDKLKALADAGLVIYQCIHTSNQALYIPQGWLVLETTLPGVGFHNGIRKAFFTRDKESMQEFESSVQLFRASAKDVSRSMAILDKMKF